MKRDNALVKVTLEAHDGEGISSNSKQLVGECCLVVVGSSIDGGIRTQGGAAGEFSVMSLSQLTEAVLEVYINTLKGEYGLESGEIKHLVGMISRNAIETELGEEYSNDHGEQLKEVLQKFYMSIREE